MNVWTFISDFPIVKITVRICFKKKTKLFIKTCFCFFQIVVAMLLVQLAWFVTRQVDNVRAKPMYPENNVKIVKMDSKIIQNAQVIEFSDF